MPASTDGPHSTAPEAGDLDELIASWRRHRGAQHSSPATISTYSTGVGQLGAYLAANGMPTTARDIRR